MSSVGADDHRHEIVIVRHSHGDHDEAHHGGVWKIAFADFMTAMMCFFLVMWLINASSDQTKAAVASYFNPVKLIDRNSSRKGLDDIGDGPNAIGSETEEPEKADATTRSVGLGKGGPEEVRNSQDSRDAKNYSDAHLFANPYAVLSEIAAQTGVNQNISEMGDGGAQMSGPATGASGGESYRDPFAPDFWTKQVQAPVETEAAEQSALGESAMTEIVRQEDASAAARVEKTMPAEKVKTQAAVAPHEQEAVAKDARPAAERDLPPPEPARPDTGPTSRSIAEAAQIRQDLAKAMGTGDRLGRGLDVVATDKGVTISVTDDFDFGMFEIGSALPRHDLVLAMGKIGKVLSAQKGSITINGHTDGRPFRSESYDNWRLSTARAHSAYYMLVRAGLDEKRVTEVAGFADRQLKLRDDPFNAANRRIEILLEVGG